MRRSSVYVVLVHHRGIEAPEEHRFDEDHAALEFHERCQDDPQVVMLEFLLLTGEAQELIQPVIHRGPGDEWAWID
jgi:hypothetical protein